MEGENAGGSTLHTSGRRGRPAMRVQFRQVSAITPERIRWLWPDWLARSKLHLLAGTPGTGKTTLALSLAALASTGGPWPDGSKTEPVDVLIWSGEDGVADTLVPRLLATGGAQGRLHVVEGVSGNGDAAAFDLSADLQRLAEVASALPRLGLLILDPVIAATARSSHHSETRRDLQEIAELTTRLGCATLGITHLAKNSGGRDPLDRVTGSVAFGAMARIVLTTVRPADPGALHRLVRAKSNLGTDGGAFEYRLSTIRVPGRDFSAQKVDWGLPLQGTARELVAAERPDEAARAVYKAEAFLKELMQGAQDGTMLAWQIKAAANAHGHAWASVHRAKDRLGMKAVKTGFTGSRWAWQMPAAAAK